MSHRTPLFLTAIVLFAVVSAQSQVIDTSRYGPILRSMLSDGMQSTEAYAMLRELITIAPQRLSGSAGAEKAVQATTAMMKRLGFQHVHHEGIMVPHWERGKGEDVVVLGGKPQRLSACALGGSIATPPGGITAEVVEVHSSEALRALGNAAKGKLIFFNRPMDPSLVSTFEAYGRAVGQRARGAVEAAKVGGVGALVRSMSLRHDRIPHTGVMGYEEGTPKVPAAAISTVDADSLSAMLVRNPHLKVRLTLNCRTLPDAPSENVVGEIVGSEKPDEIIVVGGHLDCWDKGQGAHDDGSGCVQALEALRLLKKAGVMPKRTIRAVMFMNEENGDRGGIGYPVAAERSGEHHIAALESDAGGFAPRGFDMEADSVLVAHAQRFLPFLRTFEIEAINRGGSGVDVEPLVKTGVPGFGLRPESQRYFDCHHSDNDTTEAVNPREVELGALAEATLCLLISEEGL